MSENGDDDDMWKKQKLSWPYKLAGIDCYHLVCGMGGDPAPKDGCVWRHSCKSQGGWVRRHGGRINWSEASGHFFWLRQADSWLQVVLLHVRNVTVHWFLLHDDTFKHHLLLLLVLWEPGHQPWDAPCSLHFPDARVPLHQGYQLGVRPVAECGGKVFIYLENEVYFNKKFFGPLPSLLRSFPPKKSSKFEKMVIPLIPGIQLAKSWRTLMLGEEFEPRTGDRRSRRWLKVLL